MRILGCSPFLARSHTDVILGVGFRMIGDPVPTWDAETGEMSDLETLGNDDKEPRPTILFL